MRNFAIEPKRPSLSHGIPAGPGGIVAPPKPRTAPKAPDLQQPNLDKHARD